MLNYSDGILQLIAYYMRFAEIKLAIGIRENCSSLNIVRLCTLNMDVNLMLLIHH